MMKKGNLALSKVKNLIEIFVCDFLCLNSLFLHYYEMNKNKKESEIMKNVFQDNWFKLLKKNKFICVCAWWTLKLYT